MIDVTIHIDFNFPKREASDLEELNRMLRSLRLDDLDLEDMKSYLAVTRDANQNLLHQRCGLDSGRLICTPSKKGHVYAIDTAVVDRSVEQEEFLEIWRHVHPNRVHRTVITVGHDTAVSYIILHHNKT